MFVKIKENKSSIVVKNMLTPYNKGEKELTPEFCIKVLESTNFQYNIKDMLEIISNLPQEKQAQFKDVVLSTFTNREQPNDILILGKKLAVNNSYEKELGNVANKIKGDSYIKSSPKATNESIFSFIDISDSTTVKLKDDISLPIVEIDIQHYKRPVKILDSDFKDVERIKLPPHDKFELTKITNLRDNLEIINPHESQIVFDKSNIENFNTFNLKNTSKIQFANYSKPLPPDLDFSQYKRIDFFSLENLNNFETFKFSQNTDIDFNLCFKFPPILDFTKCRKVYFSSCIFEDVKEMLVRDDTQINAHTASEYIYTEYLKPLIKHPKTSPISWLKKAFGDKNR